MFQKSEENTADLDNLTVLVFLAAFLFFYFCYDLLVRSKGRKK
jgi:hypothetical protein